MKALFQILRVILFSLIAGIFPAGLWANPGDSQIPSREISLQEYITHVRAASAALDGENTATIRELRVSLPGEWQVQSDGQSYIVKTDWIGVALLAQEKAPKENSDLLRQARQRLAAMREAAEALQSPVQRADLSESHAQVEKILRDREFQGSHEPSWLDQEIARARAWIARQFDKLFSRIGISAPVGSAIAWTLVILVALLLALWAVRSMMNAASRSEMDLRGAVPAGQDWRYWANQARTAAERGDYRGAIHAAYWTAVAQMEEKSLLPEDRSRTPRESLRLVQRNSAAYAPLSQLTRRFEITWYGFHPATFEDWNDVKKQLETLECQRTSTPATANS